MAEKRKLHGVVDRVEGDVVVVVVKDPDSDTNREVYVDKKKLKKVELKEGDNVTVMMSRMAAEPKKDTVTVSFMGLKSEEMAKKFFTYLVDGGLEDQVIQVLSEKGVTLAIEDFSKKRLSVLFECEEDKSTKAAKKPVKKPAANPVKVKTAPKKAPVKRGKKA